jgi:hypothetical protein
MFRTPRQCFGGRRLDYLPEVRIILIKVFSARRKRPQKGFTIAMTTIPIMSTVGTSLIARKKREE